LAAVLLAASCGDGPDRVIGLDGDDSGAAITMSAGDRIAVSLEANPSTGYTWEVVASDDAVLRQIGDPEYLAGSELFGAPGRMTFSFECAQPGITKLTLVYHRPWESVEPLRTFTVTVDAS
jgi:inhibitor of cysteine peptidase